MASRYSKAASTKVAKAMHERKQGTLKSGSSGKTVKSRKQAIASVYPKRAAREKSTQEEHGEENIVEKIRCRRPAQKTS